LRKDSATQPSQIVPLLFSFVMVRRKGEMSRQGIDREWPHQVALPADACSGKQYDEKHGFCRDLSLCPRGKSFRRDDRDYIVYCFADPAHAELFQRRFGGEAIDPQVQRRMGRSRQ
jgi:hypothetical protein